MAFTANKLVTTVFGNKRVVILSMTADAASGAFDSGLSVVEALIPGPVSAATGAPIFKKNQNSAATALNGSIFVKNAASGDEFTIIAVGT